MEQKTVDIHFLRFYSHESTNAFDSLGICFRPRLRFTGPTASHYIAISSGPMCRTKLVIVIILHEPWFMAVESLSNTRAAGSGNWKGLFPEARPSSDDTDLSTVTDYYYIMFGYFSRSVRIPRSDDQASSIPPGCKGCGFQIEVI